MRQVVFFFSNSILIIYLSHSPSLFFTFSLIYTASTFIIHHYLSLYANKYTLKVFMERTMLIRLTFAFILGRWSQFPFRTWPPIFLEIRLVLCFSLCRCTLASLNVPSPTFGNKSMLANLACHTFDHKYKHNLLTWSIVIC